MVTPRMSPLVPPEGRSLTAIPRDSRWASCPSGSPPPLENRISAGIGSPWSWVALESAAASGVAVKVPEQKKPFAWSARRCAWDP